MSAALFTCARTSCIVRLTVRWVLSGTRLFQSQCLTANTKVMDVVTGADTDCMPGQQSPRLHAEQRTVECSRAVSRSALAQLDSALSAAIARVDLIAEIDLDSEVVVEVRREV